MALLLYYFDGGCSCWQYRLMVADVIHDCINDVAQHMHVELTDV